MFGRHSYSSRRAVGTSIHHRPRSHTFPPSFARCCASSSIGLRRTAGAHTTDIHPACTRCSCHIVGNPRPVETPDGRCHRPVKAQRDRLSTRRTSSMARGPLSRGRARRPSRSVPSAVLTLRAAPTIPPARKAISSSRRPRATTLRPASFSESIPFAVCAALAPWVTHTTPGFWLCRPSPHYTDIGPRESESQA